MKAQILNNTLGEENEKAVMDTIIIISDKRWTAVDCIIMAEAFGAQTQMNLAKDNKQPLDTLFSICTHTHTYKIFP